MKHSRWLFILVVLFILSHCTTSDHTKSNTTATKEELLETIDEFNKAFEKCDIDKLESMITDNYVHTNNSSKSIGKKEWINYLHKRKADIEKGDLVINKYEMDQVEVEMHDDMAIVSARISISSHKLEQLHDNEIRVTNVWVYMDGDWKRAGFHDGRIK